MFKARKRHEYEYLVVRITTPEQAQELIELGLVPQGRKLVETTQQIRVRTRQQRERVHELGVIVGRNDVRVDPLAAEVQRASTAVGGVATGVRSLLQEVGELVSVVLGGGRRMPPEVTDAIAEAAARAEGEVYVTRGRVDGKPAMLVLQQPPEERASVVAEIELDVRTWSPEQVEAWPETGSPDAGMWQVEQASRRDGAEPSRHA